MPLIVADHTLGFTDHESDQPTSAQDIARLTVDPPYGIIFTDHMVTIRWNQDSGWHAPQLEPRRPFAIDPACSVLHYSQEIFEGLKAYRGADGQIYLFRCDENARRLNESAQRMSMPELPTEFFIEAVRRLVIKEQAWIPQGDGSLYVRPFMFATEPFLGVRPARDFVFCVIACPVGSYFKNGVQPITVWIASHYSRAADGGTGAAKTGGNYAGSLIAQREATEAGCDQVLFLDASEHKWVEELGGMNLFLRFADGTLVTPPLGTILPGITRKSVIELAADDGITVVERRYSKDELIADAQAGRLVEAFACGTAAVITPIGYFRFEGGDVTVGDGSEGVLTSTLRERLVAVQRGRSPDVHDWRYQLA